MAIRSQIERLEIAEIIFFCPAFFVSLYVCWRQGFGRQAGWIFLAVLSAIRVAGSACNVAAREGASDATGLMIASAVLNGIGLSFMITAVLRILERVNESMNSSMRASPKLLRLVQIPLLVGIILSIVGGVNSSNINNPSSMHQAYQYFKAASIIFLACIIGTVAFGVFLLLQLRLIRSVDRPLLFAGLASSPFVLIWSIYSIITSFDTTSHVFSRFDPNPWANAFMVVLEEFLVFIILLAVGVRIPRKSELPKEGQEERDVGTKEGQYNSMDKP